MSSDTYIYEGVSPRVAARSTGALFGIGTRTGSADWRVIGGLVAAWVATLPLASLLAGGVALLARTWQIER